MADEFMSLDWRGAPESLEIKKRIESLLMELDANRTAMVRLSTSTQSPSAVRMAEGKDRCQVLRRTWLQSKKDGQSQLAFWRTMYSMCVTVGGILSHRQLVMARFVQYKEQAPGTRMTMASAKRALVDLALTIDVHPLALGVTPEGEGQVALPKDFLIQADVVTNVIKFNDCLAAAGDLGSLVERRTFQPLRTGHIPPLIRSLRVTQRNMKKGKGAERNAKIDGVIVIEHRNLKDVVTGEKLGTIGENVIVVMTCGYPSSATKEFLHMLSQDDRCKNVPFVYFADHDVQGLHIYLILKHGSASSAFANEIQVCPQLRWAGPSKRDLMTSPVAYEDIWKAQYTANHSSASLAEVHEECKKWKMQMGMKLQKKLVAFSGRDEALVRGFKRYNLLRHEPDVEKALLDMARTKSKFRLADLAQVDIAYVSTFFRIMIVELQATPASRQATVPLQPAPQVKAIVSSQIQQSQREVTVEQ